MRILIADDEENSLRFLEKTLCARTAHEVAVASDGGSALESALRSPHPDVVILDWVMPGLDGVQVCRLLRKSKLDMHVIVATARGRREEILECLHAGADDVLTKPVAPDLLIASVERAGRRSPPSARAAHSIEQALIEASQQGDGELVVRDDDFSARVFLHSGAIAWLEVPSRKRHFLQHLVEASAIDHDAARGIIDECRRTGASLVDAMGAWGLMDRAQVREHLGSWIRDGIAEVMTRPNARSLFIPESRRYSGGLLFTLEEVMPTAPVQRGHLEGQEAWSTPPARRPTLIPDNDWERAFACSPRPQPRVDDMLDHCMRADGVLGVVAFERVSGCCLGRKGLALSPDVAWAYIRVLTAVMRSESVLDSVIETEARYHIALLVPGETESLLYAVVDATKVRLAMARLALHEVTSGF